MPLENLADLEAEWAEFMHDREGKRGVWSQDQRWRADNPGKLEKLVAYRADQAQRPGEFETAERGSPERRMLEHLDAWHKARKTEEPPPPPPPPPPPSGYGAKLPGRPSVLDAPPTVTAPVIPAASGDTTLTGADLVFRFPTGVIRSRLVLSGLQRCVVDLQGAVIQDAWDGIKVVGTTRDLWVRNFRIAGQRNQGILGTGDAQRVWFTDGEIRDGVLGAGVPVTQSHGIYLGSQGFWREFVVGNVRVVGQQTGYGVQLYENAQDGALTSMFLNTPGGMATRDDVGVAVIVSGSSRGITVADTVADGCRRQLAAGGAGVAAPALSIVECAELARQGFWADGQPGAVVGTPGSDPTIAGDPGYRLPWDTRTVGVGAF